MCVYAEPVIIMKRVPLCRGEVSEAVENVDMSLEELQQLLLRNHQQNTVEAGTSAVIDVSCSFVTHI